MLHISDICYSLQDKITKCVKVAGDCAEWYDTQKRNNGLYRLNSIKNRYLK